MGEILVAFIDWNENFSVNFAEFDEEHKKIVRMVNSLHEIIKVGKGKEIGTGVLNDMKFSFYK